MSRSRQGGIGLVGRLAVFLPDPAAPGRERLWGLVTAVIRVPELLEAAQLRRLADAGYAHELTRRDPETGRRLHIAGRPLGAVAATIQLKVPNGEWTLGIAPAGGGRVNPWLLLQYAVALAGAAVIAAFAFAVLRQPELLRREVAARTAELAEDAEPGTEAHDAAQTIATAARRGAGARSSPGACSGSPGASSSRCSPSTPTPCCARSPGCSGGRSTSASTSSSGSRPAPARCSATAASSSRRCSTSR